MQQILDMLQEAESLEELAKILEGAKGRMKGKGKGKGDGEGEGEGEGKGKGKGKGKGEGGGEGGGEGEGEGEGEGLSAAEREQLEAQIRALIQRLQRGADGNSPGPNRGRAEDGAINKGPDDGRPDETKKVDGKLDPKGKMGRSVKFKGVPRENEAREEFKEAVDSAVRDAEESLEQDEVPPDARPYVKRYFEALKER